MSPMDWRGAVAVAAVAVMAAVFLQMSPHGLPNLDHIEFDISPFDGEISPYDAAINPYGVEPRFDPTFNSDPLTHESAARPTSAAGLSQAPAPAAAIVHLPLALAVGRPYFDLPGPFELPTEFVLGGPPTSLDVVDDVAFAGIGAHLVAFDVFRIGGPTALGASPPLPGTVMDVAVHDGFAFVAVHQATPLDDMPGGLFVLDVRRSDSIEVVGHGAIAGGATRIVVDGDRAILVAHPEAESDSEGSGAWIHEFDVADADAPSEIGRTRIEGELSDIALAGGSLFACIDGDLHWSDLGEHPLDAVSTEPPAPCSALAATPDGHQLAVASDHGVEESPTLRTFGVSGTRDLSPIEVFDLDADRETFGTSVNVSAVSLRGNVAAVAGWSDDGGLLWDIRSASPISKTIEVKHMLESLFYDVDVTDRGIVTASATDGSSTHENSLALREAGLGHVLGGEISRWRRAADRSIGDTPDGRHRVPGTLATLLQTDGQRVFVQEHQSCGVRTSGGVTRMCVADRGGRVWIFDRSTGVHDPIGPFPSLLFSDNSWPRVSAVSEHGAFISDDGRTDVFDLRRRPPVLVESIWFGGAVAADEDTLVIATYDDTLHVFDVSDPSDPILQSSFEYPVEFNVDYPVLGLSDGWLWLSGDDYVEPGPLLTLFSVHDPVHPRLVATWSMEPEAVHLEGVKAIVAWGDEAIVVGYYDSTHLLAFRASSSEHLIPVIEPASTRLDRGLGPFWIAADDDRLWLWEWSSTRLPSGERRIDLTLVETDTSRMPDLRFARLWNLPPAVRARTTASSEDALGSIFSLGLRAADGLVVGSRIEGGVFGFEP